MGRIQSSYRINPDQAQPRLVQVKVDLPNGCSREVAEQLKLELQATAQAWIQNAEGFSIEMIDAKVV